ncbi:hypothetical protein ANCDUO_07743 [Ancylostoma duodenale]|uniref:Uncharacterized protein n=1 Tax=Ancylostoma duodenale TaxID=51022 RepID=A0A0C2GSK8_9BILA|nr:hypothetical protein ANCDUO_07743 [Ancylostoma duodenale]
MALPERGFCFSLSIRESNKKNLSWINEEPQYTEFVPVGAKPYTLFKSIYTNNTNRFVLPVPAFSH